MVKFLKRKLKNYYFIYELSKRFYHLILNFNYRLKRIITMPFLLIPLDEKKVFIISYFGKGYGDNGKAIVDEMLYKASNIQYDIYWAITEKTQKKYFSKEIKTVKYGSLKFYYHMSTSKIWIDNARKVEYPFKRSKQYYIQTWHGGISFKKIEKDAEESLSKYYVSIAKKDSAMIDLMISNSAFQTNLIKNSFWYGGNILEIGTPRVDTLIKNNDNLEYKNKIREYLGVSKENVIMMYAPTFRNNYSTESYINDYFKFVEKLGDNCTLLVRMHPNMNDYSVESTHVCVLDVTNYPDMYDLMVVSDILITDYSSSMFEFSYLSKPVFLLMKDYEEYMEDRGSYFKLSELPFPIAKTEDQLVELIKNFNKEVYLNSINSFNKNLGIKENGKASELLLEHIKSINIKE